MPKEEGEIDPLKDLNILSLSHFESELSVMVSIFLFVATNSVIFIVSENFQTKRVANKLLGDENFKCVILLPFSYI